MGLKTIKQRAIFYNAHFLAVGYVDFGIWNCFDMVTIRCGGAAQKRRLATRCVRWRASPLRRRSFWSFLYFCIAGLIGARVWCCWDDDFDRDECLCFSMRPLQGKHHLPLYANSSTRTVISLHTKYLKFWVYLYMLYCMCWCTW